ncbi:hypothetical protein EVAR_53757_1 [Eumeta japonica]|uniref:Uncharacterized protein n=1 Tax=Eumeta variegata TaxID=151549 RepID=A0A4C1ZDS1_EUMVA|nr:hypothetical protein EVAR_53757_1 [Eumeta japonica]
MVMMVVAMVVNDRYRTAANRCTDRVALCVEYSKCMAMPPRLQCMQLICAGRCAIYELHRWESVAVLAKPLTHGEETAPRIEPEPPREINRRGPPRPAPAR